MDYLNNKFDIIVVGAGHAGCEAAISAARLGCNVLLCSLNLDNSVGKYGAFQRKHQSYLLLASHLTRIILVRLHS